jgi:hypothetical protein
MYRNYSLFGHEVYLPKDIYLECKKLGVQASDIDKHYLRFKSWGIPASKAEAAVRAIESKKVLQIKEHKKNILRGSL